MSPESSDLRENDYDSTEFERIVWYRRQINTLHATIWVLAGCWMVSSGFFIAWIIALSRNS